MTNQYKVRKSYTPLFECQECHKKFYSTASAESAVNNGCPKCNGSDIDVFVSTAAPGEGI